MLELYPSLLGVFLDFCGVNVSPLWLWFPLPFCCSLHGYAMVGLRGDGGPGGFHPLRGCRIGMRSTPRLMLGLRSLLRVLLFPPPLYGTPPVVFLILDLYPVSFFAILLPEVARGSWVGGSADAPLYSTFADAPEVNGLNSKSGEGAYRCLFGIGKTLWGR